MTLKIGVIMDSISEIKPYKDSTFAMLLEAQRRHWRLFYMEQADLFQLNTQVHAQTQQLTVADARANWFTLSNPSTTDLATLDVILMRKDPPFNMEYIYTSYLLEQAEQQGVLIVNKPRALRDANEKLAATWFPQITPPTLVSRKHALFRSFLQTHEDIIVKPLDGMGGASIFRVRKNDPNANVIFETLTHHGECTALAQMFIPEIAQGDKRILIVDGEIIPYALARVPSKSDHRGNLAAGGQGIGQALSGRDLEIARLVAPELQKRGILFAGIDVIGNYLTEINITSPTCIRELDAQFDLNIAATLMDSIERRVKAMRLPGNA